MDRLVTQFEPQEIDPDLVRRVLVVEDDEGLNNLAQKALRRAGFGAQGVLSGAEAIARITADPDLTLLLDQQLPDMTGTELIRALIDQGCPVPFVVMTGQGDERVAVEMMKLGAKDYLVKGFNLTDLLPEVFQRVFRQQEIERRLALAETALRESEERHRLLFENASQGIGYFDLQGKIIAFNALAARRMGGSPEDFAGKSMADLFGQETGAEYRRRIEIAAASQASQTYEDQVSLPAGDLWFLSTYTRITDARGQVIGVQVISTDITERKRAEESLRESEERLAILFDQAADAIYVSKPDGQLVQVNEQACRATGYNREELLRLNVTDLEAERSTPEAPQAVIQALSPGRPVTIQSKHRRKDGSIFPVEITLAWLETSDGLHFLGIARDITERLERELEYAQILETATDGFWVVDSEGRVLEVNPAGARMLGYTQAELLTLTISDIDVNENPAEMQRHIQRVQAVGAGRFETRHRRKDGTLIDVEVSTSFLPTGQGRFVAFIRDITERKRAEEEKARLEEQVRQSQKLEAIGRLAGGVAHDFNNILTVILGHTEMALAQAETPPRLQADLAQIRQAAERSADLTRQLLAFARKQTIAPQVLDLNETVDGMLKMLRRLIGEDVNLAWLPSSDVWPVKVDPSQIDQILANLCINARDAIGGIGQVTIETENMEIDEAYAATRAGFAPGQYVILAVSDDGCGMDKATLANIFEPFFTTKPVDEGTGLGLATVYGIVKQNNGFINVYSEPARGTTFRVYLPRHVAASKPMAQKDRATQIAQGQETILLVEDDPSILRVGKLMLERFGYRVLVATTPEEAMQLAREHAGDIDLLVTDVVMPEMNGRDLAEKLNTLYPALRRLYMSGYTANVIAHHGVLEEGVNFIEKPFSMQTLAAKVRAVLDSK